MDDLPSEDVQAAIEVERRIKKRYLGESETNLRPAVHEALRRLYSLPRLPANPYFFVATALSAHSSHGSKRSVWTVGDDEVMDELEDVTLVEGGNGQTCVVCEAGTYEDMDACASCPAYSQSHDGSTTISDCQCKAGYTGSNGGMCTACETGTYKVSLGPGACTSCPANSVSPAGLCGLFAQTCHVFYICVLCVAARVPARACM